MTVKPELMNLLHNRPDPMFAFKWVLKLDYLPFGLPSHYLESVDLPFNNIQVGETIYGGGKYNLFPGAHNISSLNLVFYEDQKGTATKWIELWKSKIKNFRTGAYGLPGDGSLSSDGYKQQIDVQMVNTKNERIMDIQMFGLWPEATSNWSLGYSEDGRLTVSQSFAVDDQIIVF